MHADDVKIFSRIAANTDKIGGFSKHFRGQRGLISREFKKKHVYSTNTWEHLNLDYSSSFYDAVSFYININHFSN